MMGDRAHSIETSPLLKMPQMAKNRIIILTEGKSNPLDAKTASGILRYRGGDVVALLDSTQKGRTAGEVFGVGGSIPFISRLDEIEADTLLIGIAPAGGGLPPTWRPILKEAIERGLSITSGLHFFLNEDPELAPLARARGVSIWDVRKPPDHLTVSANLARDLDCFRVHTIGHDCNVGKMITAFEVNDGLRRQGVMAEFVATGQTGIMITGWGTPIDRVPGDFISGAIEQVILEHRDAEILVIEGQGALIHPLFSGVTLGLLHGCAPQAMILCYEAGRRRIRHSGMDMLPLREVIDLNERMAGIILPSRVIGIAANTRRLGSEEAEREVKSTEDQLGLPTTDVVRFGAGKLVEAVLKARKNQTSQAEKA